MGAKVSFDSLSALEPITFVYNRSGTNVQHINGDIIQLNNGLSFYQNKLTEDLKDALVSNNTFVGLTPIKNLSDVFLETNKDLKFGTFSISFYLSPKLLQKETLKILNNKLYVGGIGTNSLFTMIPVEDSWQEIKLNSEVSMIVDENPPFEISFTDKIIPSDQTYRKLFKVVYENGYISIQTKTKLGYRYLSYGEDRQIKANGLFFNGNEINSISFIPNFITATSFSLGYIPFSSEVGYHNSFDQTRSTSVELQRKQIANTHYLISCSTKDIINNAQVDMNLAQLKTNFNPIGTFRPVALDQ